MRTKTLFIPAEATERIKERWETGEKKSAYYIVNGEKIALRYWEKDGTLSMEYGMKGDKRHGPFRTWYAKGKLCEESYYVDGKEHGLTRQYDAKGCLIGTYKMRHGTGVDLWYQSKGVLSEERHYQDGRRQGYERWWNRDNRTVYEESHFKWDVNHGIFREWNAKGKLRRGFPRYFVEGVKVTKRQYLKACEKDPTLPKFDKTENKPVRKLPDEALRKR